jgi:hypothetical protein
MSGHVSAIADLKAAGLTYKHIARLAHCHERTIYRARRNLAIPLPALQSCLAALALRFAPASSTPQVKTYEIREDRMRKYLENRAEGWNQWPSWKRCQWRRWRAFYRKVLAEHAAGLAIIEWKYAPKSERVAKD